MTINGVTKTTSEWAKQIGISQNAFAGRVRSGWSDDKLLGPKYKPLKMTKAEMSKEIKMYRNLEEQGLLLRLPCKAGSTVYSIRSRYTKCSKYKETWNDCYGCENEDKCDSHEEYYIHINHSVSDEWIVIYMNDFGKTVFLTQAEAEQKLKEMECD